MIMPEVITPFQNAFAKGRLISDNILVAHEMLRYIKRCRKGRRYWASLKIDLYKAYDKISRSFLREVLRDMNFPPHWIQILYQCVSTSSYRVNINGSLSSPFNPEAGLRQGDHISP